ncbi:hypothetical protein DTO96_100329 [Ephemeroptericola cinctiostellae]|uniref:Uncharacterized protein n=1 Tax=Ephemeroptericola cinctiostellae TaxID=2268024 RepID=A0A345D8D1_9BURK|nr:hypothetical protein [Ephemeroptericola cinctiostellae]AXF84619.1 hypothetical protein DTO96_100329 [Ephemeroptericola cinctiostellae]
MSSEIIASIGTMLSALILATVSYWFTKKREREAELRREKLEHYKEFVVSINGVMRGNINKDGKQSFSIACNKLNLIAPQPIIIALQAFQQETADSNVDRTDDSKHDRLLSNLFYEMRKDLGVTPKDDRDTFKIGLWAPSETSSKLSS